MPFPLQVISRIDSSDGEIQRTITIHTGLTVLLGPNGSGKTHLMRGLKRGFGQIANVKKVRFLSAGRMGLLEQYRSDFDGHRGGNPNYESAVYGAKADSTRRHQMETLNGDFQTLAERADIQIKIQERLRKLFKRDLLIEWDGGNLKILFSRMENASVPYSSGREASGLMHLVGILAALYDDDVGVLLIDEPEVSLHPQLQAFLLKEILSVAGEPGVSGNKKLVVIATHSTEMIQVTRPDDLLSLVFCYDLKSDPVQISPGTGELKSIKVQALIARLGQEHKLALFCKRPLLVEGPSDVLICNALSSKMDLHLEAAGSQLLPVIGKGQFPVVAKLMLMLGKAPVVLSDADAIADGTDLAHLFLSVSTDANLSAVSAGFKDGSTMANAIYADFCALVASSWDDISSIATSHPYWTTKGPGEDTLAKRRSVFSTLFSHADNYFLAMASGQNWIVIKRRLSALLDLLEKSGLFVLRRGTIESYYVKEPQLSSLGKPMAAVEEMEVIEKESKEEARARYSDLLKCIEFAANAERIQESEALRDLLLAVVAPSMAYVNTGQADKNLNVLARTILGDRSKIFALEYDITGLTVKLESKILDVTGFPLFIPKESVDVIAQVTAKLTNA